MTIGNWSYDSTSKVFVHQNGHEIDATLCQSPKGVIWNVAHLIEACSWITSAEIGDLMKLMFAVQVEGVKVH